MLLVAGLFFLGGCAFDTGYSGQSALPHDPMPMPACEARAKPDLAGPYSLEQLSDLALENHPDLAMAYNDVEAAVGLMIQAGLYPNPTVGYMGEEIGKRRNAAAFQGGFVNQQIITAKKLEIAQAAAAHGVSVANWQAITRRFQLLTRVRQAYYEVLAAQADLEANRDIVRIAEEGLRVAQAAVRAGTGARPDVLRAEIELSQSQVRLGVSQQRLDAAWRVLATTVGWPHLKPQPLVGKLEDPAPEYDYSASLAGVLSRSAEIQAAQAAILQAEQNLRRQQVEPIPNLQLQVAPMYDFPDHRMEVNLQAGVALPIFNKNQGNILNALAELASANNQARQVELSLTERLALAFQRYFAARQQVEAYRTQIIPKSEESLDLVRKGYATGDAKFDYTTVLQAQQILIQARLASIQALGQLWNAAADIAGLLQEEQFAVRPRDGE